MAIEALTPFFSEMRKELAQTTADFERWTNAIATAADDDPRLMEALEDYATQLERIGQTAELIGLAGLGAWCAALNGILPGIIFLQGDVRALACRHLAVWPVLVDGYLQDPANFNASMELAEYLSNPLFAQSFGESARLDLIELLTTPPLEPEELVAQLDGADTPASVSIEDISLAVPENADREVYDAFLDEAPGSVEQFAVLTSRIAAGDADIDDMRSAKRIAHSFKGSASIVGIRGIAALGHHTEDVLEYFEKNPVKPPRALGRSLVMASDCLAQMVGYLRGDEDQPENSFEVLNQIVAWANKVKSGDIANMTDDGDVEVQPASPDVPQPEVTSAPAPEIEAQATLRVPVNTVDEIFRLVGEMTAVIARVESQVANLTARAAALLSHNYALRQQVTDIEKIVMLRGLSLARTDSGKDGSFDPLELDRYTELHGVTQALVEVTADAREMTGSLEAGVSSLRSEVVQQANINKELQYQVAATRLAPASVLTARLMRNVRQTCQQTGKQARLVITGGEIQIDGDVLNKLADPLLHILRNAVDHGIELPEERTIAGKPPEGMVKLDFSRQGSGIIVTIRDDGRGLDYVRIRAKAVERNLIREEQQLTYPELARLVLLPGFSTRDQVNEISGRGVGLDVVASRLANIKGTVELGSEPGNGCEVVLRFQASLVTQHTLLVEAGEQVFAIPIHYIKEAFPAGLGRIHYAETAGEKNTGSAGWQFIMRDESFPLHDLSLLTGYPSPPPGSERFAAMPKVLIRTIDGIKAILVDKLIDSRSVMVKSMGKYLPRVHGLSGVTILGDGSLVPLLNVPELLASPIAVKAAADLAAAARRHVRRILVVDDSLSVRRGLMQLLQDAAYEVKGAGDGMEAIRVLKSFDPHIICTDLEMPNMNGMELAQHLRLEKTTRHLPIIMITSRSTEKHREQARRAGVDIYLTKPYTDTDLLRHVHAALQAGSAHEKAAPA
ncbi:MAG: Chemotaxis protein histidine kinase-like protein [Candidatus Gallionella acididurans]|uniref:Chemotaxis protein CheA n=1 Tax=Candidatus Gallionella acididurans TaxID=1796491 RepID=A0A139BVU2_9PROT|nr:MAG: Chemotaxis protein histidine kinase-like protein [Candidatus Gallionella acididurans]